MNLRIQVFQFKAFIAVAGMAILLTTGCNPSLRFATVKYDAAQIRYLLDSASMTNIIFQFKSEKGGNYKKPFSLISYAYHDSIAISLTPYYLTVARNKPLKKFGGKIVLGNMVASKSDILEVIKDPVTHLRINFDYLEFTPKLDTASMHVYYNMTAHVSGIRQMSVVQRRSIQPCPPAVCYPPAN
jgi:hypothetical protein